jgi:hypothetical protein
VVLVIIGKEQSEFNDRMNITLELIFNMVFLRIIVKTIYYIIDYEMDFNIFTSMQFTLYRQHGIFTAGSTSVATSTIKIVKAINTNFMESLLGYGTISIHPEGNAASQPIELHYVTKPKVLIKRLNEFIEESKKLINIPVST